MPVTISQNNGVPLRNFQVKIQVNTAGLITNGKMQSSGNDIRFTSQRVCCKSIPFFVESGINTGNTVIWLKVDSVPANAPATFLMYFGNDTATSQSSPENVFEWWEGFDNSTSKFSVQCQGSGAIENVLAGRHEFNWQQSGIWVSDSTFDFTYPLTAEAAVDTSIGSNPGLYWIKAGKEQGYGIQNNTGNAFTTATTASDSGFCKTQVNVSSGLSVGLSKVWGTTWVASGYQQSFIGGQAPVNTNNAQIDKNQPIKLCIGGTENGIGSMVLDWIRVRKWTANPPTSSLGLESINPQPDFLGSDQTICFGEMVTFDASGNGLNSYSWSNSSADPAITVGSPGLYNVTSYLNNCLVYDYVSLYVNPLPNVEAFAMPAAVCAGDTALLTVLGAEQYLWIGLNSTSDSLYFPIDSTASIYVTGIDSNSCRKTDTILLRVADLHINFPPNISSCGDYILHADNPYSSYLWSDQSTGSSLTIANSGIFWVEVTDTVAGCHVYDTVIVQIFPKPVVALNLSVDSLCFNSSAINLSGGTPAGGTYFGSGVSGNQFVPSNGVIGSNPVYYSFTNANNCTSTANAQIVVEVCTGLFDELEKTLSVYPNPVTKGYPIFINAFEQKVTIELLDKQGRVSALLPISNTGNGIKVDLPDYLAVGLYILKIRSPEINRYLKLVVE